MTPPSDNDALVRAFVQAFGSKDASLLSPFLHADVVFCNDGEDEVHGRDRLLEVWECVFHNFTQVEFKTVHQAVNGDVVLAEQIHDLALPSGPLLPVMNMAVYEIRDGLITAWRDYTNPGYAGAAPARITTGAAGDEGNIMDDTGRLTIIEDLRRLMARYVYNADHQRWPDLAALFTADATFTPHNVDGSVARRMAGREEIATSIPAGIGPGAVLIHHLFSDEIDVDSPTRAHAVFAMEDLITRPASTHDSGQARFTAMHGYGHYRPRFTKANGRWYIAELVLTRLRVDLTY